MDVLVNWDTALFRWINRDLGSPWLDRVMAFLSHNSFFVPALVATGLLLLWKGGVKGWVFVILLGATVGLANELLVEPLKGWVERPRPFVVVPDVVLRVGRGSPNASMPSGHALLMGVCATVTTWYYPRVGWAVVPVAAAVALSRVYNGVHFPSDILVGMLLGATFSALFLGGLDRLWQALVPRWTPKLSARVPSLLRPQRAGEAEEEGQEDRHVPEL